jgi:hypothetical protein
LRVIGVAAIVGGVCIVVMDRPVAHRDYPELFEESWIADAIQIATPEEIASKLGCHVATVARALKRFNLVNPYRNSRWSDFPLLQNPEWLKKSIAEYGAKEVAKIFGVHEYTVRRAAQRFDIIWTRRRTYAPLENPGWLRKQIGIRSLTDIAREVGCAPPTVAKAAERWDIAYRTRPDRPKKQKLNLTPEERSARKRTHATWWGMIDRCHNESNPAYAHYGQWGVAVCDEWRKSFDVFVSDMGYRPLDKTLDRIDPEGNYEPSNCRWATKAEQDANRRFTIGFMDADWEFLAGLASENATEQGAKVSDRIRRKMAFRNDHDVPADR